MPAIDKFIRSAAAPQPAKPTPVKAAAAATPAKIASGKTGATKPRAEVPFRKSAGGRDERFYENAAVVNVDPSTTMFASIVNDETTPRVDVFFSTPAAGVKKLISAQVLGMTTPGVIASGKFTYNGALPGATDYIYDYSYTDVNGKTTNYYKRLKTQIPARIEIDSDIISIFGFHIDGGISTNQSSLTISGNYPKSFSDSYWFYEVCGISVPTQIYASIDAKMKAWCIDLLGYDAASFDTSMFTVKYRMKSVKIIAEQGGLVSTSTTAYSTVREQDMTTNYVTTISAGVISQSPLTDTYQKDPYTFGAAPIMKLW